jgi:predicted DNA-binding mobile mystery protein A
MQILRPARRQSLDERLARHLDLVGPPPGGGWVRAIREALGMSQFELGRRTGVSQPRVAQIERAEAHGAIELSTMRRMAAGLGCSFSYVLAPHEPLEAMVRGQALRKARGDSGLAEELVDQPGLWNPNVPGRRVPPEEGA